MGLINPFFYVFYLFCLFPPMLCFFSFGLPCLLFVSFCLFLLLVLFCLFCLFLAFFLFFVPFCFSGFPVLSCFVLGRFQLFVQLVFSSFAFCFSLLLLLLLVSGFIYYLVSFSFSCFVRFFLLRNFDIVRKSAFSDILPTLSVVNILPTPVSILPTRSNC